MRHLLSYSVYQDLSLFGDDPGATLGGMGCDGLELLTSYGPPDMAYADLTETVHLPYAPDWLAAWQDRPADMSEEDSLYFMYGRSREDVVTNVTRAIDAASVLRPAHGVFHACNADIEEIFHRRYTRSDDEVVRELCDLMNTVVGGMHGGEPPFRILFENLWWPGLRLLDGRGFDILCDRLEFDNWGICIDTGHMLACLPTVSETDGIDRLLDVFFGYSDDLIGRITGVHFHWSATYAYRTTFEERDFEPPASRFVADANSHVMNIDRHLPFTSVRCRELLDALRPDYVIHEMPGSETGILEDFRKQRSLLP